MSAGVASRASVTRSPEAHVARGRPAAATPRATRTAAGTRGRRGHVGEVAPVERRHQAQRQRRGARGDGARPARARAAARTRAAPRPPPRGTPRARRAGAPRRAPCSSGQPARGPRGRAGGSRRRAGPRRRARRPRPRRARRLAGAGSPSSVVRARARRVPACSVGERQQHVDEAEARHGPAREGARAAGRAAAGQSCSSQFESQSDGHQGANTSTTPTRNELRIESTGSQGLRRGPRAPSGAPSSRTLSATSRNVASCP